MGKNKEEGDGRERIQRKERERKREEGEDIVQGVIRSIIEKEARERRKRIEE